MKIKDIQYISLKSYEEAVFVTNFLILTGYEAKYRGGKEGILLYFENFYKSLSDRYRNSVALIGFRDNRIFSDSIGKIGCKIRTARGDTVSFTKFKRLKNEELINNIG